MKSLVVLLALLIQAPAAVTYTVSGRVTAFPNATDIPSTLILRSFELRQGPGEGKTMKINADGTFEFTGVLPPECDLNFYDGSKPFQVLTSGGDFSHSTAVGPGFNFTFVGQNVTGIEIKAPSGMNGRIVIADGGPLPAGLSVASRTPLSYNSTFRSARSMRAQTIPDRDGRFILGVFPGENTITVETLPSAYVVKSITYGSVDATANPLNLTSLPTSTLLITIDRAPGR